MPLSEDDKAAIAQAILARAEAIGSDARQLLGADPGAEAIRHRIERLQQTYGEVSNYDRHYSSTRAALTALLVTVGLAASGDALKATESRVKDGVTTARTALNLSCMAVDLDSIIKSLVLPFLLSLVLFLMAILINLYFQRLTHACELLEARIERLLHDLTVSGTVGGTDPDDPCYAFRRGLRHTLSQSTLYHLDTMGALLVGSVSLFVAYAIISRRGDCPGWSAGMAAVIALHLVAIAGGVVLIVNAFRRRDGRTIVGSGQLAVGVIAVLGLLGAPFLLGV